MDKIQVIITGCGGYLPERQVSNDDLSKAIETSDEWIRQRTGIGVRRIAREDQLTSDLATEAAIDALRHAGVSSAEVDLIIVATTTPDQTFPATAVHVQRKLGIKKPIIAFDLQAVCSGFVYALSVAEKFIRARQSRCALVIGAEIMSRILNWQDRSTCVLFGDGAGAVVLQAAESPTGIIDITLGADGCHSHILQVDGGPALSEQVGKLTMMGSEVFRQAVPTLARISQEILEKNNLTPEDIKWFVPHQANQRIINAVAQRLSLKPEKIISTIEHHANTSAASIPLALTAYREQLNPKDLVLCAAFGGGLTWGAALFYWQR